MKLQVVAGGKFSAPRIVNDHRCSKLGCLHDCLHFAPVLRTFASSFREKELDRLSRQSAGTGNKRANEQRRRTLKRMDRHNKILILSSVLVMACLLVYFLK